MLPTCERITLTDPASLAKANIAKGDRRPFTVFGFTQNDVPGVFCPSGDYDMQSRGGTFVSDMPDACGAMVASVADPKQMLIYNRTLAADPEFQRITQCRPSTQCEERYRKRPSGRQTRDPECPAEPQLLSDVAARGSVLELQATLNDFTERSPANRDAKTAAFVAALGAAKWANADVLIKAGADLDGRGYAEPKRPWLGSPLAAIFNQNQDKSSKLDRARWLFASGATLANPAANDALKWAAASNDTASVRFLLAKGALPNDNPARYPDGYHERMFTGSIESAGGGPGYGDTPFYMALEEATRNWARRTPEEIAYAETERRTGRINAVILYRAGGRFIVGPIYNGLRRSPDLKVASILFAAAHRAGRLEDLTNRILYPNGKDKPLSLGDTADERAFVSYVRAVQACPRLRPLPRVDDIKLCATGAI